MESYCIFVFLASFQHLCFILKIIDSTFVLSKFPSLFLNACQWISNWVLLRALKERSAFIKFVVRKLDVHESGLRALIDARIERQRTWLSIVGDGCGRLSEVNGLVKGVCHPIIWHVLYLDGTVGSCDIVLPLCAFLRRSALFTWAVERDPTFGWL